MILTVTLNPAVDKTCRTDGLYRGRVNRMRSVELVAGGKGINVSRMLRREGMKVTATGFLGGYTGDFISRALRDMEIEDACVRIAGDTRTTVNIVADDGYVTEILEPGPVIAEAELEAFLLKYADLVASCDMVILSGSAPGGVPEEIYARLIDTAKAAGKETLLDTNGALLRRGIAAAPSLVKPNRKELESVVGTALRDEEDCMHAAIALKERGIGRVLVSMGDRGLLLAGREGCYLAQVPRVRALNTVGCGDSVVASAAVSLLRGEDEAALVRRAAAISAACATTLENGGVPLELYEELYDQIRVRRLA